MALSFLLVFLVTAQLESAIGIGTGTSSLGTFNTELRPDTPEIERRAANLVQIIKKESPDVLCLQEVWRSDLLRQIYRNISEFYPYHVSHIDLNNEVKFDEHTACEWNMTQMYRECVESSPDSSGDGRSQSGLNLECAFLLSAECQICATYKSFLDCECEPVTNYENSLGLLLLSKRPVSEVVSQVYKTEADHRALTGFLRAKIAGVGTVYCTKLSTDLVYNAIKDEHDTTPISEEEPSLSRDFQQFNEIVTLLNATAEKYDDTILMGDFGHGPSVPTRRSIADIMAVAPFNYGTVSSYGFYSPYVIRHGKCTLCPSAGCKTVIVDHIYIAVSARKRVVLAERLWRNIDDIKVSWEPLNHYGVVIKLQDLTVCPPAMLRIQPPLCLIRQLGETSFFPAFTFLDSHPANICSAFEDDKISF